MSSRRVGPERENEASTDGLPDGGLGIDELARRCGTTVRTIREYQTLGLLPAPRKHGRVAVYGADHIRRLRAIAQLQERGYSLAGIGDLLEAWESGATLSGLLGVAEGGLAGPVDETPLIVDAADLERELPAVFAKPTVLRRALRLGLVQPAGPERYRLRSPALLQLVADSVAGGMSAKEALDIVEVVESAAEEIAVTTVGILVSRRERRRERRRLDERTTGSTVDSLRRGRTLMAQAVASTVIDKLGTAFLAAAEDDPDLAKVLDELRIGEVRDLSRH